jgi:hypothetical protein
LKSRLLRYMRVVEWTFAEILYLFGW